MDEIDAGNANVIIQVNAALSNGYCSFPDGMVQRHDDFIFLASANTFGDGASRQYVGRNQLDAATLDRFTTLVWEIDEELEEIMAGGSADGKKWLRPFVRYAHGLARMLSVSLFLPVQLNVELHF